jgi:hypothetical protein
MMDDRPERRQGAPAAGLCETCVHAQEIRSDRGSRFVMCGLSKTDPSFPRYPRLPVLSCAGYRKVS